MVQKRALMRNASFRGYNSEKHSQRNDKSGILQDTISIITITTAWSVIPGAVFFISYSVLNDFFSYLVSNISLAEMSLATAVIIFIFWAGIMVGLTATMWLYAIISFLRKKYKGIDCPLSYFGFWWRLGFGCFSLLLFLGAILGALSSYHESRNMDRIYVAIYFGITGFLLWTIIGLPKQTEVTTSKRIFLSAAITIAILVSPVFHVFVPLTNFSMETMDFRSTRGSKILVSSSAYQEIESVSKIYTSRPIACQVQFGQGQMWMLKDGRVVLGGLGPKDLIHLDVPNAPNVAVDATDVVVLPRSNPSCLPSTTKETSR